jgi:MYXO-CTERM domain-containing protein
MIDPAIGDAAVRGRAWLTRNVLALGLVSLLTDTATEIVVPLLPVFLTTMTGAGLALAALVLLVALSPRRRKEGTLA